MEKEISKLFNFGASHSIGWNCETSYSKILADRKKLIWDNHAMAGASMEYILFRLILAEPHITPKDIVLIQLPGYIKFSMHVDPRKNTQINQAYKLFHYSSMNLLDSEPHSDFIYGLKFYKGFVQTDEDAALHFYNNTISVMNLIHKIKCKKFIFWDNFPQKPETTIFMLQQLYERSNDYFLSDILTFVNFAETLKIKNKYTFHADGREDRGHYNREVHEAWANYIEEHI